VLDRKTKLIYNTNTQQDAFLKEEIMKRLKHVHTNPFYPSQIQGIPRLEKQLKWAPVLSTLPS
jgi:hypothetical protein